MFDTSASMGDLAEQLSATSGLSMQSAKEALKALAESMETPFVKNNAAPTVDDPETFFDGPEEAAIWLGEQGFDVNGGQIRADRNKSYVNATEWRIIEWLEEMGSYTFEGDRDALKTPRNTLTSAYERMLKEKLERRHYNLLSDYGYHSNSASSLDTL